MGARGPRSDIEKLPEALRVAIDKLLCKSQTTIDEATAYINELLLSKGDVAVSRSAVGRYKRRIDDERKRFREATVIAQALGEEFEKDTQNSVGRMLIEMTRTLIFDVMHVLQTDDTSETWQKVKNIQSLAQTIKDLEAAASSSVEREKKMRKMLAEEAVVHLKKTKLTKDALAESIEAVRKVYGLTP